MMAKRLRNTERNLWRAMRCKTVSAHTEAYCITEPLVSMSWNRLQVTRDQTPTAMVACRACLQPMCLEPSIRDATANHPTIPGTVNCMDLMAWDQSQPRMQGVVLLVSRYSDVSTRTGDCPAAKKAIKASATPSCALAILILSSTIRAPIP